MKILIVDDEQISVKTLREWVPWDKLCKEVWGENAEAEVFSAYNSAMAKKILQEQDIRLMICDIEMPRESGIDLIRWMRGEGYETEVIITTCHAQFSYAKEAISLNVHDYCVKPIDFQEMECLAGKLMEEIHDRESVKQQLKYGEYWMENKETFRNKFWEKLLTGGYEGKTKEMLEAASKSTLKIEESLFLVLICVKRFQMDMEKWNYEKIQRSLGSLAGDVFEGNMSREGIINIGTHTVAVCCEKTSEWVQERCERLVEVCRTLLQLHICCYVGEAVSCEQAFQKLETLERTAYEDVWHTEGVFREGENLTDYETAVSTLPQDILEAIQMGRFEDAGIRIHIWLNEEKEKGHLKRQFMENMRLNFMQALYTWLAKRNLPGTELFSDEEVKAAYYDSENSIQDMEKWIRQSFQHLEKLVRHNGSELSAAEHSVQEAKAYIEKFLSEEIGREDVAAAVHLNPDYLSRIFKKSTGDSIQEYIWKRRLEKAVLLLQTTELSMGDVAAQTGFSSSSHFSTMFKKVMGVTPREFRRRSD